MQADEDKKIDKKVDRRTFVKRGLIASGAVAGGALAVSRLADANDGSAAPGRHRGGPRSLRLTTRSSAGAHELATTEHPRDRRRPVALSAVVWGRTGRADLPPIVGHRALTIASRRGAVDPVTAAAFGAAANESSEFLLLMDGSDMVGWLRRL